MKKNRWFIWAILSFAALLFVAMNLLLVHPANASDPRKPTHEPQGTPKILVSTHYKVWTRDLRLSTGAGQHIQVTITTEYYYWKGWPKKPAWKGRWIAPFGVDLCYAFHSGVAPGLLWQGISADSEWFDDKQGVLVQDLRTGDKGRGGCVHEKVPLQNRVWLHHKMKRGLVANPFWLAEGWANWRGIGDQPFHWHSKRKDDSKGLWPAHDPVITTKSGKVWHYIFKTW